MKVNKFNPWSILLLLALVFPNWVEAKEEKEYVTPVWNQCLSAADGDSLTGCDSSRFECIMDGEAVHDLETGLVWQRFLDGYNTTNWHASESYCMNLILGGRKGWRLPEQSEISTLFDFTQKSPAFPVGHPFTMSNSAKSSEFWTRTIDNRDPNKFFVDVVNFENGNTRTRVRGDYTADTSKYVMCVRGR